MNWLEVESNADSNVGGLESSNSNKLPGDARATTHRSHSAWDLFRAPKGFNQR